MYKLIVILIALVMFTSCRTTRTGSQVVDTVYTERTVTIQDTIIEIQADSSTYNALIICDSLGQAHLSELNELKKGLRSQLINVTLTPLNAGNLLQFGCRCDSLAIGLAMYKIIESTKETKSKVETITVEVNKLNWWQQTQIYGFRGISAIIAVILILNLIKTWLNPKRLIK